MFKLYHGFHALSMGPRLIFGKQWLLGCEETERFRPADDAGKASFLQAAQRAVGGAPSRAALRIADIVVQALSLIHISEPTRLLSISYAVFCLKKKKHIMQ